MKLLGISSRINHPQYGKGVITNITSQHYWVTFIDSGLETIDLDSDFEVIEAAEGDVDAVSFFEVKRSLVKIMTLCHFGRIYIKKWQISNKTMSLLPRIY